MPLADLLGNVIARPAPKSVQDFFLWNSKPTESIYPLEASVIVGRSVASEKRGGLLELQERLPEEIGVAAIWLKGVDAMASVFDSQIKPRLFQKAVHLDGKIAWNWRPRSAVDIELTPQERFTRNSAEVRDLLQIKSLRWGISVGFALSMAAYVIPKANQLKTDWVLKHFYRDKKSDPAHPANVSHKTFNRTPDPIAARIPYPAPGVGVGPMSQSIAPARSAPALPLAFPAANAPSSTFLMPSTQSPAFGGQSPHPADSNSAWMKALHPMPDLSAPASFRNSLPEELRPGVFAPDSPLPVSTTGGQTTTQFGAGFTSGLQGVGHLVEQTPYGSILVVDAGIVGGRGAVASQRSIFETLEVVVRDVGSLYFYILCAPHLMRGLSAMADSVFKGHSGAQPRMMQDLDAKLSRQFEGVTPTHSDVRTALYGSNHKSILDPGNWLSRRFRTANNNEFFALLEKELPVYIGNTEKSKTLLALVRERLGSGSVTSVNVQEILQQLEKPWANPAASALTPAERADASVALKQAFRHSAGLPVSLGQGLKAGAASAFRIDAQALAENAYFARLWTTLSPTQHAELIGRFQQAAQVDMLDQAHSILRRSMNVIRPLMSEKDALKSADKLADWLDQGSSLHQSLNGMVENELKTILESADRLKLFSGDKSTIENPTRVSNLSISTLKVALKTANSSKAIKLLGQLNTLSDRGAINGIKLDPAASFVSSTAEGVKARVHELMNTFAHKASLPSSAEPELGRLMTHYAEEMKTLLSGERVRLFSMALQEDAPVLNRKVRGILQGGLLNDATFLQQTRLNLSQFDPDSRIYRSQVAQQTFEKSVRDYADALLKKLETVKDSSSASAPTDIRKISTKFFQMNQNVHFASRTVAMVGAMWGLGWLVPKIQYAITQYLTGNNTNPGIASARNAIGLGTPGGALASDPSERPGQFRSHVLRHPVGVPGIILPPGSYDAGGDSTFLSRSINSATAFQKQRNMGLNGISSIPPHVQSASSVGRPVSAESQPAVSALPNTTTN